MSYFGKPFDFARIEPYRIQLGLIGLAGVFSSWSVIQSLRHLDPSMLISINNLAIPLSSVVGVLIDKEPMTRFGLIGILTALLTVYLMSKRKVLGERIRFWTFVSYVFMIGLILLAFFIN
jgi:drug/metabolite transporter (DMT)-like permease